MPRILHADAAGRRVAEVMPLLRLTFIVCGGHVGSVAEIH